MSTDDLTLDLHDENSGKEFPKKPYYDKYTDLKSELDLPTLFELKEIMVRKEVKTYKGKAPKEVNVLGMVLVLLDEDKNPLIDQETQKPLAILHDINQPGKSSHEFFLTNSKLGKLFRILKFDYTEEHHTMKMRLGKLLGIRLNAVVEIKEGVGKVSGKPWKFPNVTLIQAPKDAADIKNNRALFSSMFED